MLRINKKNGFTLVELLIVIAIIGIITVIASSSFVSAQKKSRDASRKSNLKSLSDALNMYYADFGSFPSQSLIDFDHGGQLASGSVVYMKKIPTETTKAVKQFYYQVSPTGKSFRLYANLENSDDKDCLSCPDYPVTGGCCYMINSSNASINSLP
jgi:prepilin-type N-terminal cleavage/methylation domain-containing protein